MRWPACLLLAGLALAACGEEQEVGAPLAVAQPAADCRPTPLPDPPFVPPDPYPATPPAYDRAWYGNERLWTWLRADGTWPMAHQAGAYFDKSFWWAPGGGRLRVTAVRLDAPAPPVEISRANPSSRYDLGDFLLVGLELPARGCWEITGHHGAERVSFVVRVP
jgi:hypothetical protein